MVAEIYASVLSGSRGAPYRDLAQAARGGAVSTELIGVLERVCTVGLETGKARELGRAEAERVLVAVFHRTPRGRALREGLEALNRSLAGLADRRLRSVRAGMPHPGRCTVALELEGLSLTLEVGPDGIRVGHLTAG